ncbi:MAG: hypothetical protein AMXMBFR58_16490 [Phycisphaerae bacterium]
MCAVPIPPVPIMPMLMRSSEPAIRAQLAAGIASIGEASAADFRNVRRETGNMERLLMDELLVANTRGTSS